MDKISAPESDDTVKLPPVMGLKPGVYLAVIYLAVVVLILFFILIFPGLRNSGSLVVLKTEPAGAALRVDGIYRGTAPDNIFVSKGSHMLEVVLPGFSSPKIECDIPGRIFASALFPRRYPLEVTLTAANPAAVLTAAAADYAAWSFMGEPVAAWQIPLRLSEGAYQCGPALAREPGGAAVTDGILKAAARFAVTRAALRDIVRAKAITDNGGLSPSPLSLVKSAADITAFLSANPSAAAWLADTLPPGSAALVTGSAWYQKQLAAFAGITAAETLAPMPGSSASGLPLNQLRVNGLLFTGISGGTLVQGEPFPHAAAINPFMICDTEVPVPAYADFLDANPQWQASRIETLIEQKLVTPDYLSGDSDTFAGSGRQPLTNSGISSVSWFAAQAFCQWLSGKLPSAMAGYEIRLPTEAEWEYAAKSAAAWNSSEGRSAAGNIISLRDGCWEWCADFYAPLASIAAPPEAAAAAGSPERSVRGGSWLNSPGSVMPETRASLPPESCSPFVSFRPVIALKAAQQ
ncbi:MAG: SUMF1/EgtB/PvdO family nonheme iron enzyme [Treponema sp.]|jgi:hypothetical protein|nr:SUMF1/EgtB/PvdO family nonheme iron enzyme [Treponema sp.]